MSIMIFRKHLIYNITSERYVEFVDYGNISILMNISVHVSWFKDAKAL